MAFLAIKRIQLTTQVTYLETRFTIVDYLSIIGESYTCFSHCKRGTMGVFSLFVKRHGESTYVHAKAPIFVALCVPFRPSNLNNVLMYLELKL